MWREALLRRGVAGYGVWDAAAWVAAVSGRVHLCGGDGRAGAEGSGPGALARAVAALELAMLERRLNPLRAAVVVAASGHGSYRSTESIPRVGTDKDGFAHR